MERLKDETRYGYSDGAWAWMTPAHHRALVACEALVVVLGQDAETVRVEDVRQMLSDLMAAMGGGGAVIVTNTRSRSC